MATATEAKTKTAAKATAKPVHEQQPERYVELADQILEQVVNGGQSAISATRRFVTSVDDSLPNGADGPTRGHDVIDAALEMSDRIVESSGDAIRGIVRSLGPNAR